MTARKYLWRSICIMLVSTIVICAAISGTVSGLLTLQNERSMREQKLDVAISQITSAIQTSSHVLRDLANDTTLHYLYREMAQAQGTVAYTAQLQLMRSHMFHTVLTQNTFKYLMLQDEELAIIYSETFSQSGTDFHYDGPNMASGAAEAMAQLIRYDKQPGNVGSGEWVVSVYTDAGFTLSGLIDPDLMLGDSLKCFVIYDDSGCILYNGMSQWCADGEMEAFLQSGANVLKTSSGNWRTTVRPTDSMHTMLFYEEERNLLPVVSLVLPALVLLATLAITALQLRSMQRMLNGSLDMLAEIVCSEPQSYTPENRTHQLQIRRHTQSIQTLLWQYLIRICIVPILLFVAANACFCTVSLHAHQRQYARDMLEQQIRIADLHYQRCSSFLRNSAFDYLLQKSMYTYESDPDALRDFLSGYVASLWSKCSERDSLLSIAVYDLDWNRLYMTGSTNISVDDGVRGFFSDTYNDILVQCAEGKVLYFMGVRNVGVATGSLKSVFHPYGYIAIAVTDPATWLEDTFDETSYSGIRLLQPDDAGTAVSGTAVSLRSAMASLSCDIEICKNLSPSLASNITMVLTVFAVVLLAMICTLLICTHSVARKTLSSLIQLQHNLEAVYQYNLPAARMTGVEEIDFIYECFSSLATALKESREALNRKEIELLHEQRMCTDLQLAAIESQLSPHFLFNIFTSIRFLLEEDNIADAREMLKLTVQMFRSFLYRGRTFSTLEAEIDHVVSYIEVQRFRYSGLLDIEIESPGKPLLDALIPQYTLQPLVENAIEHALAGCPHLNIRLSVRSKDDVLLVTIADNGGNMDASGIAKIMHMLEHDDPHAHCGLSNIHKRLQLHFGQQYGLRFSINDARGLTVTLCIPVRYEMPK